MAEAIALGTAPAATAAALEPAASHHGRGRRRPRAEDDALTFHIALKYYAENKTAQEVADELRLERSFVSRRLKEAKLQGMVHILVTPPVRVQELRALERRLQSQFPLREATVIAGREDVMDVAWSADKEGVVLACCQAAAQWLADTLKDAGQLNPTYTLPRLVTVPIVGVTGVTDHPFEANTIAARIASVFGGQSLLLAAPAVVAPEAYDVVTRIPLSPGAARARPGAAGRRRPDVRGGSRTEHVDHRPARARNGRGGRLRPVAGRGGRNRQLLVVRPARPAGRDSERPPHRPRVARVGRPASRARVAPLRVALEQELVNVLVTDQVTAQDLLREPGT
jgi:DNA-binding transcriptional regulator LsrR (DeoR family)